MLDIFNGDAFGVVSLTKSINTGEYVPQRLGEMGLFSEERITTTVAVIEIVNDVLTLVRTAPRGGVADANPALVANIRPFKVPHIPTRDALLADEVQNVRAFGSNDNTVAVLQRVQQKLAKMRRRLELTIEYHRLGALKGIILDADGTTVIYNLFTEFGVTQQEMPLLMNTTTTDVPGKLVAAARLLEAALGSTTYARLHAIVGPSLMDKLVAHTSVKDWVKANSEASRLFLEGDLRYRVVRVRNILFEEYRGGSGVSGVGDTEGYLFAEGVPDLFTTMFAPADYVEAVNTPGEPFYAKQEPLPMGKGIDMEAQTNPLNICTRPRSVIHLKENT